MIRTKIAGVGKYLPETEYTNNDLAKYMDTTDEWIQERTGIKSRRFGKKHEETTSTMGAAASRMAIERAGIAKEDVDFIIFATLSSDYYFPGGGVMMQRELGITNTEIAALDIRNQCSGFVYGLTIADQFIKTGMYKNILLVGAEFQSTALDMSTRGRNISVIFGDGAGAVILQPTEEDDQGIIANAIHSDGTHAEALSLVNPGSHGGYFSTPEEYGFEPKDSPGDIFVTKKMVDDSQFYAYMDGKLVFKTAVVKFPEVINEVLTDAGKTKEDLNLFIPHQANLRISKFVQKRLGLRDDQVFNNIQKYGNTTAASIPIALCEAWEEGRINRGDLVCLAAFGSGFTWGASLFYW